MSKVILCAVGEGKRWHFKHTKELTYCAIGPLHMLHSPIPFENIKENELICRNCLREYQLNLEVK